MSTDIPFRLAILLMFLAAMAIGSYHRLQAAKSGERFDRRQEGLWLAITLRLAGLLLWATTILYLIWPEAIAVAQIALPNWLRWSGGVFGVAGILLMYWTLTNLGKNLTDTVATRHDATLVTRGPYRWIRHPFYVTAALLMLAAALLSANLLIAVSGLMVIVLLVLRTPKEEQKLVDKFGDDYRRYIVSTGRFLPKFGKGQDSGAN
jgi:protein-S-isoprenylcysteine O-methyltransferase Ste14